MVYYVHVCATAYRCARVRVIVSVPNVPANLPALQQSDGLEIGLEKV